MIGAAEDVGHVPVCRLRGSGDGRTSLHVLRVDLAVAAIDVGADGRAADHAQRRRHVVAGTAADLVTEDTTDDAADDRARDIGSARRDDVRALDPAALLRRADDGAGVEAV
jgi:hypothetical protein